MSILIKDVEMPQENELIIISSNGDVEKVKCDGTSCLCDSKAIELPPHGRLIDTNTLKVKHGWLDNFDNTHTHIQFVYANEINNAPTIIEAEEDKI